MADDTKEFTIMFYFASDNPLAISSVSQLKAIKAAGWHQKANVIVQFDPFTEGTPTHIFDVNMMAKLEDADCDCKTDDDQQRLVLNLVDDKLWNGERARDGKFVRTKISEMLADEFKSKPKSKLKSQLNPYNPPHPPNGLEIIDGELREPGPQRSLNRFLEFCSYAYPAKHYLLFILGHGVVVGNDVFLFDENADEQSLKLGILGTILKKFSEDVTAGGGSFDLVGFHSCSVASLEVAYELKDHVRYMLASQGTTFVGSWPYKQMLRRVFDTLKEETVYSEKTMKEMLAQLFFFCMENSTDFLLAGYPFDLALYDLSKISTINEPLERLSKALIKGLENPDCADLITLAHWKSQSFYQEMYTDLYDFCFCLRQKLKQFRKVVKVPGLIAACEAMMDALANETGEQRKSAGQKFIVCSESAGPEYQYAHGLSVYFPWTKPPVDRGIVEEYANYKVSEEFKTKWLDFLNEYWEKTMRETSREEQELPIPSPSHALFEDKLSLIYTQQGPRDSQNALDLRAKIDPKDPMGGDGYGISIKNFPRDIRGRLVQGKQNFALSKTFLPPSVR